VSNKQLHKHDYKQNVSWGSLRESLASLILFETDIIKEAKIKNQLYLWDPFCGSGTILLEALHIFLGFLLSI
jgi:23S rRNA G2445 N2-methylase RlmL